MTKGKPRDSSFHALRYWRLMVLLVMATLLATFAAVAQNNQQQAKRNGSHSSARREKFSAEERETVEQAIGVVCSERVRDARGSVPIDDMQKRPSLPLQASEV